MKNSENSLKNISRPWILADNWHLHVCQKVISWAFYLLSMLSFQKKKENYDKKEFLISVKIFYPTKKVRPFKNYYFIIWFHGIYCKCNVCSFTMYVVLYKQRPCSLLMKRSLPEIQFSGSQYVSATKFCWRQIVFPKKFGTYIKLYLKILKNHQVLQKTKKSPGQHTFKNHLGVVLVPPLICSLLMEIIH